MERVPEPPIDPPEQPYRCEVCGEDLEEDEIAADDPKVYCLSCYRKHQPDDDEEMTW